MFGPRLASGIVLIIIALATMSFGGWALAGILLAISLVGYRELTKALNAADKSGKFNLLEYAGFVGIILYYAAVYFSGTAPCF